MAPKEGKNLAYLTKYTRDYPPKPIKKTPTGKVQEEYSNLLREDDFIRIAAPFKENEEYGPDYLEKFKKQNPRIYNRCIQEDFNIDFMEKERIRNLSSIYATTFHDKRYPLIAIKERKRLPLPENWDVPLTMQKLHYRNPALYGKVPPRPPLFKPQCTLGQDETFKIITKVTTGISDYMSKIGSLGAFAVENSMHGDVTKPCRRSVEEKLLD